MSPARGVQPTSNEVCIKIRTRTALDEDSGGRMGDARPTTLETDQHAIDLLARFGARCKIRRDAGGATWYETPTDERLWLLEVPCRHGIVYPQGGEILAAWTDRSRIGSRLRALPCVLSARGDIETVVTFHVDDARDVLRILKPYRRRRLSEAQRARQAEILARARLQRHRESLSQGDFPAPESTQSAPDKVQVAPPPLRASGAEASSGDANPKRAATP